MLSPENSLNKLNPLQYSIAFVVLGFCFFLSGYFYFVMADVSNEISSREQLFKTIEMDENKIFYSFDKLPLRFSEQGIRTIHKEDSVISVWEEWKRGENYITSLLLKTEFQPFNDIVFVDEFTESQLRDATKLEKVTVKEENGIYSSYRQENFWLEKVKFVKHGVQYTIYLKHQNDKAFGEKYLINLINNHLVVTNK